MPWPTSQIQAEATSAVGWSYLQSGQSHHHAKQARTWKLWGTLEGRAEDAPNDSSAIKDQFDLCFECPPQLQHAQAPAALAEPRAAISIISASPISEAPGSDAWRLAVEPLDQCHQVLIGRRCPHFVTLDPRPRHILAGSDPGTQLYPRSSQFPAWPGSTTLKVRGTTHPPHPGPCMPFAISERNKARRLHDGLQCQLHWSSYAARVTVQHTRRLSVRRTMLSPSAFT